MTEDELIKAFTGYPEIFNAPIFENEDGDWVGYGHFDKHDFVQICRRIFTDLTRDPEASKFFEGMESEVDHAYAYMMDEERYVLCASDHSDAFPITVLYI